MNQRHGYLMMEMVLILMLLGTIMSVSVMSLKPEKFREHAADVVYLDQLKGAILDQRMRSVREPGVGYNFVLPGDGTVYFQRQGVIYLRMNKPEYQIWVDKGVFTQILTLWDFKNRTKEGNNGFTIEIWKRQRLIAKLIYQVGTSTFREEFYD